MTDNAKLTDVRRRITEARRQMDALAPLPQGGEVTAAQLARYMAVRAQERFAKGLNGPEPLGHVQISAMCGEFAAEFALTALAPFAPPDVADEVATQIWGAICDGGGIGEWLWEHLGGETVRQVTGLAAELADAQAEGAAGGEAAAEQDAEMAKLRSGAQTLGRIVVRQARSMEAARIEMQQNGPEKAMQWILNSLPDVDDNDPADQWDGKESAAEWLDRTGDGAS